MSMDTIDLRRLPLEPGMRVLDLGCGEGRHSLTTWLQAPVTVIGIDLSLQDLQTARERQTEFEAHADSTPPATVPVGNAPGQLGFAVGSALQLPLADDSMDVVICSEVLEHIFDYRTVIAEARRVLKPGGWLAVSVPRAWPERFCWWLSDPYHEAPGGHIRIFKGRELVRQVETAGFRLRDHHGAHALHVPYWWLRCASRDPEQSIAVRGWHRLLVWDLMQAPRLTRLLERMLNPVLGKSVVWYFQESETGQHA